MSVKSKSILVKKGEGIDELTIFLQSVIGLDAYLLKGIASTAVNDTVTQLTVMYQEYPDTVVDSFAPRPGSIIPNASVSASFDTRVLFSSPIDYTSIVSGTFLFDDVGLDTSVVSLDYNSNNYYVKINTASLSLSGMHEFRIDATKIKKLNGSYFDYSAVAGYTVNSLGSSQIGDRQEPYASRRRGLVKADIVRVAKGTNPQQGIEEYLTQRGLEKEQLLAYTFSSRNDNLVEVYFVYLSKVEPQIVDGYPLTNTLIPYGSSVSNITLIFSTKLDSAQLTTVNGLFSIESDYNTSVNVSASDVTVLPDLKTVQINLSGYCYQDRIYSIVARPGIKSLNGFIKAKPEQWILHLSTYEATATAVAPTGSVTGGAPTSASYVLVSPNGSLPNSVVLTGRSGITITPDGAGHAYVSMSGNLYANTVTHLSDTSNPHATTYTQVGAPSLASFTGHTGTTGIHFTQSQIAIPASQITDFSGAVVAITSSLSGVSNELFTGHTGRLDNPHVVTASQVGAPTLIQFTGHTGRLDNPHAVTASQVGAPTLSQFTGHTGRLDNPHNVTISQVGGVSTSTFNTHTTDASIHFLETDIDHRNLLASSIGTNTHADIDNHIADTNNPHSVTFTQVGSPSTSNFSYLSGIVTGHTGRLDNPHQTTAAQLGAATTGSYSYLSGLFTGHTGRLDNPHATTAAQVGAPTTSNYDYLSGQYNTLNIAFTGHTGNSTIHFTQAQISIPSTQISDWTEAVQDTVGTFFTFGSGVSGNYNDAGNTYSISGVYATTTRHGVAQFNSADFTVSNGNVSWTRTLSTIDISDFVLDTAASGNHLKFDGTNWVPDTAGIGDMVSTNNLSDVANKDTARKNLMVRYYIDDMCPLNSNVWSQANTASGASYQYDPQYASFIQANDCQGVVISSNGIGTGRDQAALMYHSSAGLWPASGVCFYFRVAIANTGSTICRFGLTNTNHGATGDVANGVYFEYNSSTNGFWLASSASGNTRIKGTTTSTALSTQNAFRWYGIENCVSGYRFYDFTSGSNPLYYITDNTALPSLSTRAMRAFTQCIGNGIGATFRGVYLDKFAYPIYTSSLPSGIA